MRVRETHSPKIFASSEGTECTECTVCSNLVWQVFWQRPIIMAWDGHPHHRWAHKNPTEKVHFLSLCATSETSEICDSEERAFVVLYVCVCMNGLLDLAVKDPNGVFSLSLAHHFNYHLLLGILRDHSLLTLYSLCVYNTWFPRTSHSLFLSRGFINAILEMLTTLPCAPYMYILKCLVINY